MHGMAVVSQMLNGPWELGEHKEDWRGILLHRARQIETGREFLLEELALAAPARDRILREIALGLEERVAAAEAVVHPALKKPLGVTRHQDRYYVVRPADETLWAGWGPEPRPRGPEELGNWLAILASIAGLYHQAGLTTRGAARCDLVPAEAGLLVLEPNCESYLAAYRDRERFFRHELAPEVTRGGSWGREADIFALGMTAYELAAGRLPIAGHGAVLIDNLLSQAVVDPRTFAPGLAPEPAALILGMLARDPAERPDASRIANESARIRWAASAEEMAAFARLGRQKANYVAGREKLRGFLRRNKVGVGLTAAAVLVLVVLFAMRGPRAKPAITASTSPAQVVAAYYRAIDTLNFDLLEETLAPKVGGAIRNTVLTMHVVGKVRLAYEAQRGRGAAVQRQLEIGNLTIKRLGSSPPAFLARYDLVLHQEPEDQYSTREDRLTLGRIKNRRVGEKWAIVKLETKEIAKRRLPRAANPGENAAQTPPRGAD